MKTNCIQWKVKVRWEDKKIKDTLLCLVVAWRKGKERGRGRQARERRENRKYFLLTCLEKGKKEKKKMWEFYLFIVWFAKGKEKKNVGFYFFVLINNEKNIITLVIS